MILLDTSVLVEALGAGGSMAAELRGVLEEGERVVVPTLVLYEWLRGPRVPEELEAQEALFPSDEAVVFGPAEARWAARLYGDVPRPRRRAVDLAIAACALTWNARLWTLNRDHFEDVPGLELHGPAGG